MQHCCVAICRICTHFCLPKFAWVQVTKLEDLWGKSLVIILHEALHTAWNIIMPAWSDLMFHVWPLWLQYSYVVCLLLDISSALLCFHAVRVYFHVLIWVGKLARCLSWSVHCAVPQNFIHTSICSQLLIVQHNWFGFLM